MLAIIAALLSPSDGQVLLEGREMGQLSEAERVKIRREKIGFTFQSNNLVPYLNVQENIELMLRMNGKLDRNGRQRALDLIQRLGLEKQRRNMPDQLSGGQKQRVVIARALALAPEFVVLDEPTAALDVSVQAQVILLLKELRDKFNMTYLFISHDLALVSYFCRRILVMYLGRLVEIMPAAQVSRAARHPYTKALMDSVFVADPAARKDAVPIEGEAPSPFNLPRGCVFQNRCPQVRDLCRREPPSLTEIAPEEYVACHFPLN